MTDKEIREEAERLKKAQQDIDDLKVLGKWAGLSLAEKTPYLRKLRKKAPNMFTDLEGQRYKSNSLTAALFEGRGRK